MTDETLDSWKEIAGFLHRGVRTARRWELLRGLPVHRIPGAGKPGVFALRSELEGWEMAPQEPVRRKRSIAVMPFTSLGADREYDYLSQGLASGTIAALTRVGDLRVIALGSTAGMGRRSIRPTLGGVGARLLLKGSVQYSGRRVRVSAQLVDAIDGVIRWSDHFDRELHDVFLIQDELSCAIANAVAARLSDARVS